MGTGREAQCVSFETPNELTLAGCFQVNCDLSGESYTIIFDRSNKIEFTCDIYSVGKFISQQGYKALCVDPRVVCAKRLTACPNDCFYRGKCQENGKCSCDYFYEGDFCQFPRRSPKGFEKYWAKLKELNSF